MLIGNFEQCVGDHGVHSNVQVVVVVVLKVGGTHAAAAATAVSTALSFLLPWFVLNGGLGWPELIL